MINTVRSLLLGILLLASNAVASSTAIAGSGARIQVVATVGGQPDDITTDTRGRLVWGDLTAGTVDRLQGGKVVVVLRGLSVPEGIVALKHNVFIVAEQGFDRISRIDSQGHRTIIDQLQPVAGQEGIDAFHRATNPPSLLVPDSPRGTVYRLDLRTHRKHLLAQGLGRPVDAMMDPHGNVLVPDEHLGTLVVISPSGRISHRGTFSTPDDVAIDRTGRIWVTTLGDGALWVLTPHRSPRRVLTGLLNPQGLTLDTCGDPVIVEQTVARIVRLLLTPTSARCAF